MFIPKAIYYEARVRMSMNPQEIINKVESGTSRLDNRIKAMKKYFPNVEILYIV